MIKQIKYSLISLTLILIVALLVYSCEATGTNPTTSNPVPVTATSPLVLTGYVRDASSNAAISGASIILTKTDGTSITSLITDSNGKYSYDVTSMNASQLNVNVTASTYGSATAVANISQSSYLATVPNIYLSKVNGTSASVAANTGGQVNNASTESISTANVSVQIPANSLSANTTIVVSSISVNNTVNLQSSNQFLAAVARFEPSGTTFQTPVTVTLPLPYVTTAGKTLPVYLLDNATLKWNSFGSATVSSDGKSATFQTTHFSEYGTADNGSYTVSGTTTTADGTEFLLSAGGSVSYSYTPVVSILTNNTSLADNWIKNTLANSPLVSQYGLRIDASGSLLPVTISTPTVVAPPLPDTYKKLSNGVYVYTNPSLPNQNGTWSWQGVYIRNNITINGTITLGSQSDNFTLTIKQYAKVRDQWTWTQTHDQGAVN